MKNNIITAGVDEVGRGCLAGPVVSAAVILNDKIDVTISENVTVQVVKSTVQSLINNSTSKK